MRFYGLNVLQLPLWQIGMLSRALSAIRAEEMIQMAFATRMAAQKQHDFERTVRHLERMAEPLAGSDERPAAIHPASDRAREWFVANGIRVIEA